MLGARCAMRPVGRVRKRSRIGLDRRDGRVVGVVERRIDGAVDRRVVRHRDFPAKAGIGAGQECFRLALGKARTGLHVQLVGDVVVRRTHEGESRLGRDPDPNQGDRPVAGPLQVNQPHERHHVAHMEARGRRVEADVPGHLATVQGAFNLFRVLE